MLLTTQVFTLPREQGVCQPGLVSQLSQCQSVGFCEAACLAYVVSLFRDRVRPLR
jgi:hypothetical protein